MMDSGYRPEGGGVGCVMWILIAACFCGMALMMSGGDDTTSYSADVELLSRNQANIASTVFNTYNDCLAAGSCVTYTTEIVTSTQTTSTRTDIAGDRNVVTSNELHWCAEASGRGYWTSNPCDPGYTQAGEGAQP